MDAIRTSSGRVHRWLEAAAVGINIHLGGRTAVNSVDSTPVTQPISVLDIESKSNLNLNALEAQALHVTAAGLGQG